MQQSNIYIITFSLVLTILGDYCQVFLKILGPAQKRSQDLDTKKQILGAIPAEKEALAGMEAEQVLLDTQR